MNNLVGDGKANPKDFYRYISSQKKDAFRKWPSCETQLATVINDWAKILDNKGVVDSFVLDLDKAFNTSHMNSLKVN